MSSSVDVETDLARLMAEVEEQQRAIEEVQREIRGTTIAGSAERGLVTVAMDGGGRFSAVTIEDDAVRQFPASVLGEVVLEAIHDAMDQLAALTRERYGPLLADPSVLDDGITYQRPPDPGPVRA